MVNLKVNLPGLEMKNPVIPASGTFGFGYEFTRFYDINVLGSIMIKGTTLEPRYGNPLPRIAEGPSGMLNAIGLQNPGVDAVMSHELEELRKCYNDKVIANIGGSCVDDYVETAKRISTHDMVGALELNISCPNVHSGGIQLEQIHKWQRMSHVKSKLFLKNRFTLSFRQMLQILLKWLKQLKKQELMVLR